MMNWSVVFRKQRSAIRFCVFFALSLTVLAFIFEQARSFFAATYMYPVSSMATTLLNWMSFEAILDTSELSNGFCEMALTQIVYRVTFDCTGVFALIVFLALTAAYPAAIKKKGIALLIGIPAIFVFSCLRLVVLGIVAYVQPEWIELFHVYVMELATLGFMLYVWKYWINQVVYAG